MFNAKNVIHTHKKCKKRDYITKFTYKNVIISRFLHIARHMRIRYNRSNIKNLGGNHDQTHINPRGYMPIITSIIQCIYADDGL